MPAKVSSPLLANAQLIHDLSANTRLDKVLTSLQDEPALLSLQQFFKLNDPTDAILLAWFLVNGWPEKEVRLQQILEAFGNDLPGIEKYRASLQALCSLGLLLPNIGTTKDGADMAAAYSLPLAVLEAVLKQEPAYLLFPVVGDIRSFLSGVFRQIKRYKDKEIDRALLVIIIIRMEEAHRHLPELQQWLTLALPNDERLIMYFLLRSRMEDDYFWIDFSEMGKELFADPMEQFWWVTKFRNSQLALQKEELINTYSKDMSIESRLRISPKTFDIFFPGTAIATSYQSRLFDIIQPSQTTPETLYFNGKEAAQLALLQNALQPQALNQLRQALRSANHSPAITVLLHGHPGTGKTASVLQWARQSERAVLRVEIEQVRSKWLGESERNLSRIFDDYESACREYAQLPILLFNEADALLSKRITVERSVDQIHNNLQNILLQALEDFQGILVATTNLARQMDGAFDRRFLYKVEFSRPEKQVRLKVLRDVFPDADDQWLEELDDRYELTGAQIRNLGKRLFLQQLLQGGATGRDTLLQAAADELSLQGSSRNPSIGFQVYKHCS